MLAQLLCMSTALAGSAHHHPDDVAGSSVLFAGAAKAMGPAFAEVQSEIARLGRAADSLSRGTAMLGPRAPAGADAWSQDVRKQVSGQFVRLQRHVDLIQQDYGQVFGAAYEAALASVPGAASSTICKDRGLMHRGPPCQGINLSPAIAKEVDRDANLAHDLDEISDLPWPAIGIGAHSLPVVPLTGASHWLQLDALAQRVAAQALETIDDDLTRTLDRIEDDLAPGTAPYVEAAQAAREVHDAALTELGTHLLQAVDAALDRGRGAPEVLGLCVNPTALGGCPGEDITAATLDWLQQDKRFLKALR
jgi:ElaB/YqjD/DUF883 family membrane-anchored ribosome-binding protein